MDIDFIIWIQQFSNGLLDSFFIILTNLGNRQYYIVILTLIYWCINKKETFRFGLFLLISAFVNTSLKTITNISRPSQNDVRVLYVESTGGTPSFPSGHAQGSTSFFGYIFGYFKNKFIRIGAVLLILLISISRIYLGLHHLWDVLAGMIIAIILLIIYHAFYEPVAKRIRRLPFVRRMLLSIAMPLVLLVVPGYAKAMVLGFAAGMLTGYQLENRYIRFKVNTSLGKQVLKYAVGILGLAVLEFGGNALLSHFLWTRGILLGGEFLQYLLMGLWTFFIGPWFFVLLNLADTEKFE